MREGLSQPGESAEITTGARGQAATMTPGVIVAEMEMLFTN